MRVLNRVESFNKSTKYTSLKKKQAELTHWIGSYIKIFFKWYDSSILVYSVLFPKYEDIITIEGI